MRSSELAGEWETQSNDSCKGMETVRKATDQSRCHLSATYLTDAAQTAPTARLFDRRLPQPAGIEGTTGSYKVATCDGCLVKAEGRITMFLGVLGLFNVERSRSPGNSTAGIRR